MNRRAVIVLPTYNEAGSIHQILSGIATVRENISDWEIHVLVVDSNSDDGTGKIVTTMQQEMTDLHILHTEKEGLGKAYLRGFEEAMNKYHAEVVFQMDADLSHNPSKIPEFLSHIDNGADLVIGSRYIKGGSIPEDWAPHRKLFSVLGNLIIRIGFMNLKISDWTSGYRAIRTDLLPKVTTHLSEYTGYVFQVALVDNAKKAGARIAELPITFVDRTQGSSKIDSVEYIIQTLIYVFLHSSFVKFVIVGGTGFVLDSIILYVLALQLHFPAWLAKLISAETVIISNFTLNNLWSFAHKSIDRSFSSYIRGLFKFNLVSTGNIGIQMLGIQLMTWAFGLQYILIYNVIIIVCIVIPYSYFFYNKFIWKDNPEQK